MRRFAEIIGWVTIVCALLGTFVSGLDFRYCLAPKGTCFEEPTK